MTNYYPWAQSTIPDQAEVSAGMPLQVQSSRLGPGLMMKGSLDPLSYQHPGNVLPAAYSHT